MKREMKRLFYIFFGIALFAALMNFRAVIQFLGNMLGLISPVLIGLLFAFVLNVPMTGFEHLFEKLFRKAGWKVKEKPLAGISLLLTLVSIVLVVVLAFTMAIPALVSSVKSIYPLIMEKLPEWLELLNSYEIDISLLTEWTAELDWEKLSSNAGNLLGSAVAAASTTISGLTSGLFGVIIGIYILLSKKTLAAQVKKLLYANLQTGTADRLCYIGKLTRDTYAKFLSGQCVEAMLLGGLIALAFYLFRLPYAMLVGFLTSLFAFVPYIGALTSCLIAAFLVLLAEPSKVLVCLAVYLVVQFVENQFIYPRVVGGSVGLSPLWTLIAALVGGKLFGLAGIIFFIPLAAVFYTLVREDTNRKLAEKETLIVKEEVKEEVQE